MMDRNRIYREFVDDSIELLEELERRLLELEQSRVEFPQGEPEVIRALFRDFHTLKGTAGFFELELVVEVSHEAETLLDIFRNSPVELEMDYLDCLMETQDYLHRFFKNPRSNQGDSGFRAQAQGLTEKLLALVERTGQAGKFTEPEATPAQNFGFFTDDPPGEPEPKTPEIEKFGLFTESEVKLPELAPESPETEIALSSDEAVKDDSLQSSNIRIDTDKLDALMELVGEFSISVSLVEDAVPAEARIEDNFRRRMNQLKKSARSLQELSLSLRMVPLSGVFQKTKRIVRDLQRKTGKSIALTIKGGDTEVDKSVSELISDPLMHLLRNAVDHGLESEAERLNKQKTAAGRIVLEARYNGGEVWILLRDDGRGLDREKILNRARKVGLLEGEGANLSDRQVWGFIFQPGFSTATEVTDVSGRGVGMDVVEKNLTRLNGRIDLYTRAGRGTLFIMKIPLTLSIMEGMVVRVGEDYFIIPTAEIRESIAYDSLQQRRLYNAVTFIQLREQFIPVFTLNDLLKFRNPKKPTGERPLVVIMEYDYHVIGVVVDEILGNAAVVVKSVYDILGNINGISGCTILGSGRVGLILDVKHLVAKFQRTGPEAVTTEGN